MGTLRHGRFEGAPSDALKGYTHSLDYDKRLAPYDIEASSVHVNGLWNAGIIDDEEARTLLSGLLEVARELEMKTFQYCDSDEDIHTAVERRLTEIVGPVGAKLHTGRSRNDQISTDVRMFNRAVLTNLMTLVTRLQETLLGLAHHAGDAYVPGYTHVQRAQPVLLAHHFAAHGWALARDFDRLYDSRERADVSPLGAGALGGSTLPLDPQFVTEMLGFAKPFENSLDAVSDRDFVADTLYALSMIGIHLSRIGEEIVLWSSHEFGFVELDDAYATGSSMLPQKKNADIAELARGKAGRLIGNLAGFLATLKGLPLAYNRDLQEDKEPLFDSTDQVSMGLVAVTGMLDTAEFRYEQMKRAADDPSLGAIDLAEWLVIRGMPFRAAHAEVGAVVRRALAGEESLVEIVRNHQSFGPEAAKLLQPGEPIRRRVTDGGGGIEAVGRQLGRLGERLDLQRNRAGIH